MRIEIEIPKEFEKHFTEDKFKDSLERIMADIKHSLENGDCLCAGRYEFETVEMLKEAFENSRQAYDINKVVEELGKLNTFEQQQKDTVLCKKWDYGTIKKAIEIIKQGAID